jgi:hypothetical protein
MDWLMVGLYRLTMGGEVLTQKDKIVGYMDNVLNAQSGDLPRTRKAMKSYAVPEQAAFTLIAAQRLNMIHAKNNNNLAKCLPKDAKYAMAFFKKIKLYPDQDQYMVVLESYGIDSADEKEKWWDYLCVQGLVKERA